MPDSFPYPAAGAATADIIQQYVSAIKALSHVDPGGAILSAVGSPIAAYLRGRRDTIRCIVTMLTADEEDAAAQSLFAELGNAEGAGAEVGMRWVEAGGRLKPAGLHPCCRAAHSPPCHPRPPDPLAGNSIPTAGLQQRFRGSRSGCAGVA